MAHTYYTVRIFTQDETTNDTITALKLAVTDGGGTVFADMQYIRGFVFYTPNGKPNPLERAMDEYGDGNILVEAFEQKGDAGETLP